MCTYKNIQRLTIINFIAIKKPTLVKNNTRQPTYDIKHPDKQYMAIRFSWHVKSEINEDLTVIEFGL